MDQAKRRVTLTVTSTLLAAIAAASSLLAGCTAGIEGDRGGTGTASGGSQGNSTGGSGAPAVNSGGSPGSVSSGGAPGVGGGGTATGGRSGTGGGAPVVTTGGTPGSGGRAAGTGGSIGRDGGAPDAPVTGGTGGVPVIGPGNDAAAQLCVDTINMYRATLGLAPYMRWTEQEACVSNEALLDSQTNTAHSAFGMCTENAQNECPGWSGSLASIVTGCLQQMWAEGPGADFNTHGHYINMSSTRYTRAACGFATAANGRIWAAQDFR